ncbi:MAG TPA: TMEM175 family protein [Solirubrobacterales bacterium]
MAFVPGRGSVAADPDDPRMARERTARKREEHEVEFSRIVAFSDGVFSIAITLLVLNIKIDPGLPSDKLAHELLDQHEQLLAYAISFAVIARFWVVHHSFFSEVTAFDGRLIALNMLYLGWLVLIPFSSQVLGEYGGQLAAVIVYSANLTGVVLIGQWMAWDARRAGLTKIDAETAAENLFRGAFIAAVFLLSIVVALFDASIAPFCWLLLFVEGRSHMVQRLSRRTP